jgi:hypothetical protein
MVPFPGLLAKQAGASSERLVRIYASSALSRDRRSCQPSVLHGGNDVSLCTT